MSSKILQLDVANIPHVFVYGTLKRGESNNRLLEGATFVGEATTLSTGVLNDWGAPCFSHSEWVEDKSLLRPIRGEVFEIDVEHLYYLDKLEGHPRLYYRSPTVVDCEGHLVTAWCYYHHSPADSLCPVIDGVYVWNPK